MSRSRPGPIMQQLIITIKLSIAVFEQDENYSPLRRNESAELICFQHSQAKIVPLGTRRCCDVESTSMTLIQRRNDVVCPVGLLLSVRFLTIINPMPLPFSHVVQNSGSSGLRSSTLPLGHGASSQRIRNILFISSN